MKVLIIGGGIGGLTTGIALSQKGHDVEIFESAPELKPVGAGIVLANNALKVFETLSIDDFQNAGNRIQQGYITKENLEPIKMIETIGLSICLHRAELHRILVKNLGNAQLHLGKCFKTFKQISNNEVEAIFEDGTTAQGNILIGADGIHSQVRHQFNPAAKLRYSGQTCWRGTLDFQLSPNFKNKAFEAWSGKPRFGFVEYEPGKVYWYACLKSAKGGVDQPGNLKEELLKYFSVFDPIANKLIENTEVLKIHRGDLFDLEPSNAKWFSKNVCLIGDAAHATTPNLGQGACQAIEDGMALSMALSFHPDPEEAFSWFQKKRQQRTNFIVENSWQVGKMAHWQNSFLKAFRNFTFKLVPKSIARKHLEQLFDLSYLQKK